MLAMSVIKGAGMLAMLMTEGTRHACHISFVSDQVCLPSFLVGTRYAAYRMLAIFSKFKIHFL